MTKVTKIFFWRYDERDRLIVLVLSLGDLKVAILKTNSQCGKPLNFLPIGHHPVNQVCEYVQIREIRGE